MPPSKSSPGVRRASAFAPGHVTGIFTPDVTARDPRGHGSRGAGIVLEIGVTAEAQWDPHGPRRLDLDADVAGPLPITNDVARRLIGARSGRVSIRLIHQLPVSQGFGMSAAGAVATALALSRLFRTSRQKAIEVAHLAELFGGGGLGGVAAILGGGLEVRLRAGVPPFGRVAHRSFAPPVVVGVVGGPIPSPRILQDEHALARIARAADTFASRWAQFTPTQFLDASEQFTDAAGLTTPALARTLRALRSRGGWAAQAMFGRSFFVVPRTSTARRAIWMELARRNLRAIELRALPARPSRPRNSVAA
jgi:pantoate kinase